MPEPTHPAMPATLLDPGALNRSVAEFLEFGRSAERELAAGALATGDYVMGFRLPDWQRPAVWTPAQQIRFVESAWLGLPLGSVVVTERSSVALRRFDPLDRLLIDGQQRLRALTAYLTGALCVYGATWDQLSTEDRQRFLQVRLGLIRLGQRYTAPDLKLLYARMNYGGTPHAPEHFPAGVTL